MGYRSEAELDALDGADDDSAHAYGVRAGAAQKAKPARIDIGNGRAWAKTADGSWAEMDTFAWRHVMPDDAHVRASAGCIRFLAPAEVERAERGLGPVVTSAEIAEDTDRLRAWCVAADENIRDLARLAGEAPGCPGCDAPIVAGPAATEDIFVPVPPGGGAVAISSPQTPAGLTPEQAARYTDSIATTLRRMIADASAEFVDSYVRFFARSDETAPVRVLHDELSYAHASYVISGFRRWDDDLRTVTWSTVDRIRSALGATS